MKCETCSEEEHRRAPVSGSDIEMRLKGYVTTPSEGGWVTINLWQCPQCKDVALETETA